MSGDINFTQKYPPNFLTLEFYVGVWWLEIRLVGFLVNHYKQIISFLALGSKKLYLRLKLKSQPESQSK